MASGSLSVGGIAMTANLPLPDDVGESGIAPVTSPPAEIEDSAVLGGMVTEAMLSLLPGVALLKDCRPIGIGDVIEGSLSAGLAPLSPGEAGDAPSTVGMPGGTPVSSSVIAILNVPSTITTTLA